MKGLKRACISWATVLSLLLMAMSPLYAGAETGSLSTHGLIAQDDDDGWDDDDLYDDDAWDDDDVWDDDLYDDDDWDDDDDAPVQSAPVSSVVVDTPIANQAILQLSPGTDADAFADEQDVTILRREPGANLLLVDLNPAENDADEVNRLLAHESVLWSELNYTSRAPEGNPRFFFTSAAVAPRIVEQPALPAGMTFDPAVMCTSGSSVVVAVLDTGVDTAHPSIQNNLVSQGVNFIDPQADVQDTGDQVDSDQDGYIDEMVGHGTHVTGTILLVAPDAGILPVKVLDSDGIGDTFSVTAGIFHAVHNGAGVINLSLGTTHDSVAIRQAVAYAESEGVVVVAAAGNDNQWQYEQFPASIDSVISVASHNDAGDKSDFSNYNQNVDVTAPGENVASAYPGGLFATASGTSMASPIVAGTVAHVLEHQPGSTSVHVKEMLHTHSVPLVLADPSLEPFLGAGRLNVPETLTCP